MVDITGVEAVVDVIFVNDFVVVVIVVKVVVTDVNDIALVVVDVMATSKDQTNHFYILLRTFICRLNPLHTNSATFV